MMFPIIKKDRQLFETNNTLKQLFETWANSQPSPTWHNLYRKENTQHPIIFIKFNAMFVDSPIRTGGQEVLFCYSIEINLLSNILICEVLLRIWSAVPTFQRLLPLLNYLLSINNFLKIGQKRPSRQWQKAELLFI